MAEDSRPETPPRRVTLLPGETIADAARRAIASGVESLERHRVDAQAGGVEPLHQLRVSTRRLRASIELLAGVIYAPQLKIFRRDIPEITHDAGAVRECDVTAALLKERARKIDPNLADAISPMLETLDQRRKAASQNLRALLESRRYRNLVAKLSRPAVKKLGADRKLGAVAPRLLRPVARGAFRIGDKLTADAPASLLHKLRVRLKRLRYELEMMASLGAKRHKKTLARLEELQELLGVHHDTTVAAEWLLSYAETSGAPPKTILAAGALLQSLAGREEKLRRRCVKMWRRFERSDAMRDTLEEIRRAGKLALTAMTPTIAAPDKSRDTIVNVPQSDLHEVADPPTNQDSMTSQSTDASP